MTKTETSIETLETKYIGVSFLEIQRKHDGCKLQLPRPKTGLQLLLINELSTLTHIHNPNIGLHLAFDYSKVIKKSFCRYCFLIVFITLFLGS